jgi:hypothetical protein
VRASDTALQKAIGEFVAHSSAKAAARGLSRALPLLDAAFLAYELYRWGMPDAGSPSLPDWSGWTQVCGSVKPEFAGLGVNCGNAAAWAANQTMKVSRTSIGSGQYVESVSFGRNIGLYPGSSSIWTFKTSQGYVSTVEGLATRHIFSDTALPTGAVDPPMTPEIPAKPPAWDHPMVPLVNPMIDPFSLPILKPVVDVPPLPYRDLPNRRENPWRNPQEQPQRGPVREVAPVTDPWLAPSAPTVSIDGDGNVDVRPGGDHQFQRPGRNTKEKKTRVSTAGTAIRVVFDAVSEVRDFVQALWDALPRDKQTRVRQVPKSKRYYGVRYQHPTLQQMLADLYNGLDDVDWNKAFDNVMENEIKDRAYGKLGRVSGQAGAALGKPVGVGLGPTF